MTREIEWVSGASASAASAPLWHPKEKRIYWSDVANCRLYAYAPATGAVETVLDDGRPVGAMTLQADGSLLLFRDQANVVVFKNGEIVSTVIGSISDYKHSIFASAAADGEGCVVCSVLSDSRHTGRLVSIDRKGRLTFLADGFGIPGGIAFATDSASFYFCDSHITQRSTRRFEYGIENGFHKTPSDSVFHECFDDGERWPGAPAGIALSDDGSVWITRVCGAMIVRHGADGVPLDSINLPVRRPQGLCFGGDGLSDIYVTTSGGHRRQHEGLHAGELAIVRASGFRGMAPFLSRINLPEEIPEDIAVPEEEPVAAEVVAGEVAGEPSEGAVGFDGVPPVTQEPQAAQDPVVVSNADSVSATGEDAPHSDPAPAVADVTSASATGDAAPAADSDRDPAAPIPGSSGAFVSL